MDKDILRSMISEIMKELDNLSELKNEMNEIKTETSKIFVRSMGSILHDFYNCCERIFKRISLDINGGFEESEKWHKALLFKMTIPIQNIRPAVLSEELAAELDEYLSFRHVFRNIYGFELKGKRILNLAKKFDKVADRFIKEMKAFLVYLDAELKRNNTI